jgi:hypothetical protein
MEPKGASQIVWVRAAISYFALVFGTGFALGILRTLLLVPQVGSRMAELIETPFMIAVSIIACSSVIRRYSVPPTVLARAGMGLLALTLLIAAELALNGFLTGRTVAQYIADKDPVSGSAYLLALVFFGLIPLWLNRGLSRQGNPE